MTNEADREDYLWNPRAAPQPEIVRWERALQTYRFRRVVPERRRFSRWSVALVTTLASAASFAVFFWPRGEPSYRVLGSHDVASIRAGEWIETHSEGTQIEVGTIGAVSLDPGTRLRVDAIGTAEDAGRPAAHSLYLERGSISARIVAGPRVFQVGTPAGVSIDLGCEYRLEIAEDGRATIRVDKGQIAFGFQGREVFVPAGASCQSLPGFGPLPPFFDGLASERRQKIEQLAQGGAYSSEELRELLDLEEYEDALPLFAMLGDTRLTLELRVAIYERLEPAFERPAGVDRAAVLQGEPAALAAWLALAKPRWRQARVSD